MGHWQIFPFIFYAGFDFPRGICPKILLWASRFFRLGAQNSMYNNQKSCFWPLIFIKRPFRAPSPKTKCQTLILCWDIFYCASLEFHIYNSCLVLCRCAHSMRRWVWWSVRRRTQVKEPLIKSMRTVKKETLKLISGWVSRFNDAQMVSQSWPQLGISAGTKYWVWMGKALFGSRFVSPVLLNNIKLIQLLLGW